jgi:hypothetical protein
MIATLQRKYHWKYVSRYRRDKDKRWWSDEEIRIMFGMTKYGFKRALAAYRKASARPHWTQDKMARAVLRYAVRHKRWPNTVDLDKRNQQLALPPRSSMETIFGSSAHLGGEWESPVQSLIHYIVRKPELRRRLTPELILTIRNVTVRRLAMESYGVERLLRKGGGFCAHEDEFGKLWRLPTDNHRDDCAQWVEVVNATAEPDGSYNHFFLRVPPHVATARGAVAWTFNEDANEFEIKMAT